MWIFRNNYEFPLHLSAVCVCVAARHIAPALSIWVVEGKSIPLPQTLRAPLAAAAKGAANDLGGFARVVDLLPSFLLREEGTLEKGLAGPFSASRNPQSRRLDAVTASLRPFEWRGQGGALRLGWSRRTGLASRCT
eukprot:COSAG06_NODE_29142_length_562_cov_0.580994_2_plen_136_part_00